MEVGPARHFLLIDLVISLIEADRKLLKAFLVVSNGTFDLSFLDIEASDLLTDAVVLLLFDGDLLLGLIVLFLDLSKLYAHFIDLLLLVLGGSGVVSWVKKRVDLNECIGTIIDLKFLLHDSSASALELGRAGGAFSVTVHF